jgi:hypothetical protein
MLLDIELYENLVEVADVTITWIFPLRTLGIFRAKLDAPEPN